MILVTSMIEASVDSQIIIFTNKNVFICMITSTVYSSMVLERRGRGD